MLVTYRVAVVLFSGWRLGGPVLGAACMRRPLRLRRTVQRGDLIEGVDLRIGIEVRTGGGPLPARAVLIDQVDGMRPLETPLYRRGAVARGGHLIHAAPRGRYRLSSALVRISDPFWLAETQVPVERADVIIVYPQVVPLEGLFTDAGSAAATSTGRSCTAARATTCTRFAISSRARACAVCTGRAPPKGAG